MNIRKTLATGAASIIMLAATALPTFASSNGVAGTWQIVDHGPGAWAGGTLNQDFTANGSGEFAYKASDGSQEVAHIDAVSWSFIDATTISLCANVTGQQGLDFPIGVTVSTCIPVVISGPGQPVPSLFDPDTFTKVILK